MKIYSIPNYNTKNNRQSFNGRSVSVSENRSSYYYGIPKSYDRTTPTEVSSVDTMLIPTQELKNGYSHRSEKIKERYYIASPFEKIPQDVYKNHTKIQKNDLYLSQIKKDYGRRVNSFSVNAKYEKEYLLDREKEIQQKLEYIEEQKKKHADIRKHITKINFSENIKTAVENRLQEKEALLDAEKTALVIETSQIPQKIELAEKRFAVLDEMDKLEIQKNNLENELGCLLHEGDSKLKSESEYDLIEFRFSIAKDDFKRRINEYSLLVNDEELEIRPQSPELLDYYNSYNDYKGKLQVLSNRINFEKARVQEIKTNELPALKEQMDNQYEQIKDFYNEYYPEYTD